MPNKDPMVLGLYALAWVVADENAGPRLLAVTGLDAGSLREAAGRPATLAAVLGFLEAHEPDLLACAEALQVRPQDLVLARIRLDA